MTESNTAPEAAPAEHGFQVTHFIRLPGHLNWSTAVHSGELTAEAAIAFVNGHHAEAESDGLQALQAATAALEPTPAGDGQQDPPAAVSVAPATVEAGSEPTS